MISRRYIALAAGALLVLIASGCARENGSSTESEFERDLTLAEQSQQAAALMDVPKEAADPAPPPVATKAQSNTRPQQTVSRPAATPTQSTPPVEPPPAKVEEPPIVPNRVSPPAPSSGTIAAGTVMTASIATRVCTSAKPGEKLVGRLSESVSGSNGVSIPAGATVVLEVISTRDITDSVKGTINFRIRSIESEGKTYAVVAAGEPSSALERTRTTTTKDDAKKVVGGAIAGAIIGQVIGKDTKGTVTGAAAGAAAGTAVAIATAKYEGCLNPNGTVRIVLSEALIVPIGND